MLDRNLVGMRKIDTPKFDFPRTFRSLAVNTLLFYRRNARNHDLAVHRAPFTKLSGATKGMEVKYLKTWPRGRASK